jgi:hypothetical protein
MIANTKMARTAITTVLERVPTSRVSPPMGLNKMLKAKLRTITTMSVSRAWRALKRRK